MISSSRVLVNLSSAATVFSPDRGRVLSCDRVGRWIFYFGRGETFKRSLASEAHLRLRDVSRQRRRLGSSEAMAVFEEVHELAYELIPVTGGEAREWLATEGCTWNGGAFCNFYMDRPFRMLDESQFRQHAERARNLLGRGLRLRRGIFLADGNALAMSNSRLDPLLATAREVFPGLDLFGFVDLYSSDRRHLADWEFLRDRGLQRVFVGMETGLDELLEFVDKPGSRDGLREFVTTRKQAGLQVALIVMVGLRGEPYRVRHREASLGLLLDMPLDRGDLIYLSPFVEHHDSRYRERREAAATTPMNEVEVEDELTIMASSLRAGGLRVSRYDIREFVY